MGERRHIQCAFSIGGDPVTAAAAVGILLAAPQRRRGAWYWTRWASRDRMRKLACSMAEAGTVQVGDVIHNVA
jgi:hypothetical protein